MNQKFQAVLMDEWRKNNPNSVPKSNLTIAYGGELVYLVPVEDEWVSVDKINTVIKELELSLEPEQMVLDNPQKYHRLDVSQARLTHTSITACINIIKKILAQPPSQTNKPE